VSRIYVGPTPLFDLGMVGELDLLTSMDGTLVVPEEVSAEITVEPAKTAMETFFEENPIERTTDEGTLEQARNILGDDAPTASAAVVAGLLAHRDSDDRTAVVSGDRLGGVNVEDRFPAPSRHGDQAVLRLQSCRDVESFGLGLVIIVQCVADCHPGFPIGFEVTSWGPRQRVL
jgi:hypothetical protein